MFQGTFSNKKKWMRRRRGVQGERNRKRVGARELCFICIAQCESVQAGDALVGKPAFMLHHILQPIKIKRASNLLPPREQRDLKKSLFLFLRKAFPIECFFPTSFRCASTSSIARQRGFGNARAPAFTWCEKTIYRHTSDLFRKRPLSWVDICSEDFQVSSCIISSVSRTAEV